jgi:amidase
MLKEYADYDALGLAGLVKDGSVHPRELLETAIKRVENLNPKLNAIIHTFYDRARMQAESDIPDGPFKGVPFLLKDLLDNYQGEPICMGSRGIRYIPTENSELVNRYLRAGVIPFGKTSTPELGLTITTEPAAYGAAHNPWRRGISTGGSSGGSAAAVAARIVPIASGSDGGGSIRFPSACCGVFGLKPSRGLNPLGPENGDVWDGAVSAHILTRTVRDSAAMLDQTAGPDIGAPYLVRRADSSYLAAVGQDPGRLRIAFSKNPFIESAVHPEAVKGLEKTVRLLESLGHHVEEADPVIDRSVLWKHFVVVVTAYVAGLYEVVKQELGRESCSRLEPFTQSMAMIGRSMSAGDLVLARIGWHEIQLAMGQFLTSYDAFLTPALVSPPVPHKTVMPTRFEDASMGISSRFTIGKVLMKTGFIKQFSKKTLSKMGFTVLGNITGLPSMSMPLHWTEDGLPLGMMITGQMCDEITLFRLAGQLEQACPWIDKKPDIS